MPSPWLILDRCSVRWSSVAKVPLEAAPVHDTVGRNRQSIHEAKNFTVKDWYNRLFTLYDVLLILTYSTGLIELLGNRRHQPAFRGGRMSTRHRTNETARTSAYAFGPFEQCL
jgi:hypothetical protein